MAGYAPGAGPPKANGYGTIITGLQAIPSSLTVLAAAGNNLIIDDIFGIDQTHNYAQAFRNLPVLYVGVYCSITVLAERERQRGDRGVGTAQELYKFVYSEARFDITVDTVVNTPDECGRLIKERLEYGVAPDALTHLIVNG